MIILRGGRVVCPSEGLDDLLDVLLDGERIAAVGLSIDAAVARTVDCRGLVIVPGLIDMHVHLREPGYEAKETIRTGVRAAVRGGFTTVCAMPNTQPVNDRRETTEWILAEARRSGLANVLPIAAVTRGSAGEHLVDIRDLVAAGAIAFSDDGRPVESDPIMRRALEEAEAAGSLVIDHCEVRSLAANGVVNAGPVAARLGVPGIPPAAEDIMVARDIALARETGTRVHIAHVSTAGATAAIAAARRAGVRVSAEATPHHLLLTEGSLASGDSDHKMNPPLRSASDVAALVEALRTGVVDVIATDHAPHTAAEKARGLLDAPFGIVGLETAVSLVLDRFVAAGIISLGRFVDLLSANPARLLGLARKGRIAVGADADLTVLDPDLPVTVDKDRFESKGRNTPFHGWTLRGAPVMTIVGGRIVYPFDGGDPAERP
ncbi:MAG: dihydroorotase [Candidatus Aminicenantes bacterium]|nr:dihydroorotase [Candidatus Aminicenantes bacterium]